ncbi:MAG: hypothetical protein IPN86_10710 [Saprospiraceae bacterium]|nr:hypothetical protein [Saprospiraceae bacterium]
MAIEKAFWFFWLLFWAMQKSNCRLHKAKANSRYTTFGQNQLKGLHLICLL